MLVRKFARISALARGFDFDETDEGVVERDAEVRSRLNVCLCSFTFEDSRSVG